MSKYNPFLLDKKDYVMDLNPVKSYVEQASLYISKTKNISLEDAIFKVKNVIKNSDAVDPTVTYYERKDNGDKHESKISLVNFLGTVKKNNESLAPSFTSYLGTDVKDSLHKNFVLINLKSRSVEKKLAKNFKDEGNLEKASYHDVMQKTKKIFNNSLSGAYASKSTILFNPSAHYTLTSITRAVASIGNALTEIMVSGNRHYKDGEVVMNHFAALINGVDRKKVADAVIKFSLKTPTTNDIMEMVKYNTLFYWGSVKTEKLVFDFVEAMDDIDKCIVLYVNDLFHIRKHNEEFMRIFLNKLHRKRIGAVNPDYKRMEESEEYVMNLVHHICTDEIQGKRIDYKDLPNGVISDIMIATTDGVNDTIKDYEDFIKAFFTSNVMPVDIAYIKEMTRRCIVLSDTDSTCGSYTNWVEWYFGKLVFSPESIALSAAVMTVTTQVIDHFLKTLSGNMNVDPANMHHLAMKNEYFWPVFAPASVSKHYYAGIKVKEGSVYVELERELKGVNFIASNIPVRYQKRLHDMIDTILKKVSENELLDLPFWINVVADIEKEIISSVHKGDVSILKTEKIKDKGAYKLEWERSPYYHYELWQQVFADKYSQSEPPQITALKVPTILNTKRKLSDFLENIKDEAIKRKFTDFMTRHPKDSLGTLRLPYTSLAVHGVPDEIKDVINIKRIIKDITAPFILVLGTLGYNLKDDMTLTELGY